jgi:hypothetical protein
MRTKWILIGVAATVLAFSGGCQTTHEIGKSGTQLFRGETGATVQQSPQQVAQAIDAAIADAKLIRINATTRPAENKTETIVVARDNNDTRIQVAYVPVTATSTRVVVSTGAFGDSDLRDRVWDAVRIRLGLIAIGQGPTTQPASASAQSPATQPAASAGN